MIDSPWTRRRLLADITVGALAETEAVLAAMGRIVAGCSTRISL